MDSDGDITDKNGNIVGKAERWTEPEEPEPEVIDLSELAGKKVRILHDPFLKILYPRFRSIHCSLAISGYLKQSIFIFIFMFFYLLNYLSPAETTVH